MNHIIRQAGICALAALLIGLPAGAQESSAHDHAAGGGKVIMIPRDLELRLAVDALPPHLREGAGIWILNATGYVKTKDATNPFTCIVSRRGGNFYPVCLAEERTRTTPPAFMDYAP